MNSENILLCPFCSDEENGNIKNLGGYDKIGLKDHLQGFCEAFDETISVAEDMANRRKNSLNQHKEK